MARGATHLYARGNRTTPRSPRSMASIAGTLVLGVLFTALGIASYMLRQDIAVALTIHELQRRYPDSNVYRITYYEDGWTDIDLLAPYELRQPTDRISGWQPQPAISS